MACGPSVNVTWLGKLFRFYTKILHLLHRISPEEICNEENINTMAFPQRRRRRHQPMHLHSTVCTLWSTERPTRSRACSAGAPPPPTPKYAARGCIEAYQHGSRSWPKVGGLRTLKRGSTSEDRDSWLQRQQNTPPHDRYSAATPREGCTRQHRSSR